MRRQREPKDFSERKVEQLNVRVTKTVRELARGQPRGRLTAAIEAAVMALSLDKEEGLRAAIGDVDARLREYTAQRDVLEALLAKTLAKAQAEKRRADVRAANQERDLSIKPRWRR